jgi:hypothetical protein
VAGESAQMKRQRDNSSPRRSTPRSVGSKAARAKTRTTATATS